MESADNDAAFSKELSSKLENCQPSLDSIVDELHDIELSVHTRSPRFRKIAAIKSLCESLSQCSETGRQLQKAVENARCISSGIVIAEAPLNIKKPLELTPQEQELAYELKAQLMKNIDTHCKNIKNEIQTRRVLETQRPNNLPPKYKDISRTAALKMLRLFEIKAREANSKFESIERELTKCQKAAEQYKELYERELHKNATTPVLLNRKAPNSVASHNVSPPRTEGWNLHQVLRRSEILSVENEDMKKQLKLLRKDNLALVAKQRAADEEKLVIINQLSACEASRVDLQKRLAKEHSKIQQLEKSFTKQARDWIESRQGSRLANQRARTAKVCAPRPITRFEKALLNSTHDYKQ